MQYRPVITGQIALAAQAAQRRYRMLVKVVEGRRAGGVVEDLPDAEAKALLASGAAQPVAPSAEDIAVPVQEAVQNTKTVAEPE